MTLQVTAAPWSAKGIIAALRETNHIVLDRFSVKECNNKTCICCTTACAAWLNEFYGWIKHGPSVDQFFRLLHSPLFLNGPGYPSPWGCPRWISILLGWRMCKAHPKTYRAAFLKCLALWAPKDCHLLFLFKTFFSWRALWNANLHFSNPEGFQPGFTVLWLCTFLLLSCFSNKICFLFDYRTPFSSLYCRSLVPSVHPSSTAGVGSPSSPWATPSQVMWNYHQLVTKNQWGRSWAQEIVQNTMKYHVGMAFPCYAGFYV